MDDILDTQAKRTGAANAAEQLTQALSARTAKIGVMGLGYVGLPLAAACARAKFSVTGFDTDPSKVESLAEGKSYIDAVSSEQIAAHVTGKRFEATSDFDRLTQCDVIVICVPTPLTRNRVPNLSYVEATAAEIARRLRPGQLIVLESTTFPGTTDGLLRQTLERSGLRCGQDFFIGFSPEREDPGNIEFTTSKTPKVVAGCGDLASKLVAEFYGAVVEQIVSVTDTRTAEAVKLTENIFRAVNIALVNELKVIYEKMGVDIWEVIDAASTKPFGFMPFYPGPGLGGHCIPIDPFYLTWKAREFDLNTRFIELAGEINSNMPGYVVSRLERALDQTFSRSLGSSSILIIGLAYKKNVSDIRESPTFKLLEILEARGAAVSFHDPFVGEIPPTREYAQFTGRRSQPLTEDTLKQVDAVLIVTDHDAIDYQMICDCAPLIADTRNAIRRRGLVPKGVLTLA